MKTFLAVVFGKLTAHVSRLFKLGSGTSLPGKVALKLDPHLLSRLGKQVRKKRICITGTNGKSTTAGLLSAFIESARYPVVHNQLGANMVPGITAALLAKSSLTGKLNADYAVIEADEASLPQVAKAIQPDWTVVTNLFRDQLDRYGELDTTAKLIREGITVGRGGMILNADDPMVAAIGTGFAAEQVLYYGVNTVTYPADFSVDCPVSFPKEVMDCPLCQSPLIYDLFLYGHLGHYRCEACGFSRPKPWVEASHIEISTMESTLTLNSLTLTLKLPGLFNAYNLIAAVTAGLAIDLPLTSFEPALATYHSIFGRAEHQVIDGKSIRIFLIKNPTGAMEVLKVVSADPKKRILIIINDNYADGRDISWLWDAPFEFLSTVQTPITVSGHRAEDMAVRLKYAGISEDRIKTEPVIMSAFQKALSQTPSDETLYVLPTYTALLHLSQALGSR